MRLTIISEQRDPSGELARMETAAEAEYYLRGGSHFLLYEETVEDGGAPVKSMLKATSRTLEHTKKGEVDTRMVFEAGKDYRTEYRTPYGSFLLDVRTHALRLEETESGLSMEVRYELSLDGEPLSEVHMTILATGKRR